MLPASSDYTEGGDLGKVRLAYMPAPWGDEGIHRQSCKSTYKKSLWEYKCKKIRIESRIKVTNGIKYTLTWIVQGENPVGQNMRMFRPNTMNGT